MTKYGIKISKLTLSLFKAHHEPPLQPVMQTFGNLLVLAFGSYLVNNHWIDTVVLELAISTQRFSEI